MIAWLKHLRSKMPKLKAADSEALLFVAMFGFWLIWVLTLAGWIW